jgi:hypothetical protein
LTNATVPAADTKIGTAPDTVAPPRGAVIVTVAVEVGVAVAVALGVAVAVAVAVPVLVGDAVAVAARVAMGVALMVAFEVAVAVAVAVPVAVADGVGIAVGVGVAVGTGGVPFATPFNAIATLALPLVALLTIESESWKVPSARGPKRTVTKSGVPLAASIDKPAPLVTAKSGEPVFPIVTVIGAVPISSTEKLADSLAAVLRKVISLKVRFAGAIFISPKGVGVFLV